MKNTLIKLGTKTFFGKVVGVTNRGGERYYFLINKKGDVLLMPAILIEEQCN
jgi:hypothetical protein